MAYSIAVSNISIVPENFTYGDVVSVTCTVTNTSTSGAVYGLDYYIMLQTGTENLFMGRSGWGFNGKISKNASKTFTQQIRITTEAARAVQESLLENTQRYREGFWLVVQSLKGSTTEIVERTAAIESKFFDEHKGITFTEFTVQRCDSEGSLANEGTSAMLTAKFTMPSGFVCKLTYPNGSGGTVVTELTQSVEGQVISGATFDTLHNHTFTLTVSDGIEVEEAVTLLPAAAANVHLSGLTTGGVALGRFSSARLGTPKLESNYQAWMYKGITGVNVFREAEVKTGGRWIDQKPLYRRTYHATTFTHEADQRYIVVPKASLPDYEFIHIIDAVASYAYNELEGYWSGSYANGEGLNQLQHDNLRFYIHPTDGLKMAFGSYLDVREAWVTIEYTKPGDSPIPVDAWGDATGTAVSVPDDGSGGGSEGGGDSGDDMPETRYLVELDSQGFDGSWSLTINSPDKEHYAWFRLESGSATVVYYRTDTDLVLTGHLNTWVTLPDFRLATGANLFAILGNDAVISVKYSTSATEPPADQEEIIVDGDTETGYPANRIVTLNDETKSVTLDGYAGVVPMFITDSADISVTFTNSLSAVSVSHTLSFESALSLQKGINLFSDCAMTAGTNTYTFTGTGTVTLAFVGRDRTAMPMAMSGITGGRYKYYSSGVRVMPVFRVTSVSSLGANFAKYTEDYASYLKQHNMGAAGTFEFEDMSVLNGQTAHVYSGAPRNSVSVSYYLIQD